jgi:hypothetical protein
MKMKKFKKNIAIASALIVAGTIAVGTTTTTIFNNNEIAQETHNKNIGTFSSLSTGLLVQDKNLTTETSVTIKATYNRSYDPIQTGNNSLAKIILTNKADSSDFHEYNGVVDGSNNVAVQFTGLRAKATYRVEMFDRQIDLLTKFKVIGNPIEIITISKPTVNNPTATVSKQITSEGEADGEIKVD